MTNKKLFADAKNIKLSQMMPALIIAAHYLDLKLSNQAQFRKAYKYAMKNINPN